MGSKTLQIHHYYRISEEQSISTVSFQTLIWNEIVGYRWRKNGQFRLSAKISNFLRCYHGEILTFMDLQVAKNAFVAIFHIKMLREIDAYNKPQPQSPYNFMQISSYIIFLTQNSVPSKIAFPWSLLHLKLSQNFLL